MDYCFLSLMVFFLPSSTRKYSSLSEFKEDKGYCQVLFI
jgi:hypothetical protein